MKRIVIIALAVSAALGATAQAQPKLTIDQEIAIWSAYGTKAKPLTIDQEIAIWSAYGQVNCPEPGPQTVCKVVK